jgi:SAM-dependent methyltransferase
MHDAVVDYVKANTPTGSVLEFGSRNVNGTLREVVTATRYIGVDCRDGDGVDIVADAATVDVGETFDVVLCTEVFEHVEDDAAQSIIDNAYRHLDPGGTFVATMAGVGRHPHSAIEAIALQPGEFYRNITIDLLDAWLTTAGFVDFSIDVDGRDIRCTARKAVTNDSIRDD